MSELETVESLTADYKQACKASQEAFDRYMTAVAQRNEADSDRTEADREMDRIGRRLLALLRSAE